MDNGLNVELEDEFEHKKKLARNIIYSIHKRRDTVTDVYPYTMYEEGYKDACNYAISLLEKELHFLY